MSRWTVPDFPYKEGETVWYQRPFSRQRRKVKIVSWRPDVCKGDGFLGFEILIRKKSGEEIWVIDNYIKPLK